MAQDSFTDLILEAVAPLGDAKARRMFGGIGFYLDNQIFAIVAFDRLYFRTGPANQPDYQTAGSAPFVYEGKGKPIQMPYWELPAEVLEDPEEIRRWAIKALAAGRAAAAGKPKKNPGAKRPAPKGRPKPAKPARKRAHKRG